MIAFVGSVFSPYYAWRRRRGPAEPAEHCALNVVLYGAPSRWAMTERGSRSLARDRRTLRIGPSGLTWDGDCLTIAIDERCAPWPTRLRGTVRVRPAALSTRRFTLDDAGRHRWRPLAPNAAIEVALEQPTLSWSGRAYLDTNDGDEPLERAFARWQWSRAMRGDEATIFYDVRRRDGSDRGIALAVESSGAVHDIAAPPLAALPRTRWGVGRATHADPGHRPRVVRTLTDAPFYARSIVASRLDGVPVTAVHESLSLDRFTHPLVQAMLTFRIPRALR